ncbi:hypothetical protein GWK47_046349 [Chionoecetes opilio]|uniref:Uncharacterized protein n=1 Tax=Chionoecetes opilio TaxID=41210 RepID=A0A8J4YEP8_CHIOP|nr:hypothetical protein GWK47_046349 [Chionoecetes opilio]
MDVTDLFTLSSSSSFASLLESEEDFTFGAKTTPFLPPATTTTTTTAHHATPTYSLPDWMEGRDIIGLPDTFQDLSLPLSPKDHYSLKLEEEVEDDFYTTIKPEDMLVPLSELLPPHTPPTPPLPSTPPATPPPAPATPLPAPATPVTPLPKIIICRKVTTAAPKARPIQINYQVIPVKPKAMSASLRPLHTAPHTTMPLEKSHQSKLPCP